MTPSPGPAHQDPAPNVRSMPVALRINVAGHSIAVSATYVPGQTLGHAEAEELNRTRLTRLRTALRAYVQKNPTVERLELQRLADNFALVATGELGLGPDPTELQALEIARGTARAQLARQGQSVETYGKEAFESLVKRLAESEVILGEARRRVLATQKIISEALGSDLGLDGL